MADISKVISNMLWDHFGAFVDPDGTFPTSSLGFTNRDAIVTLSYEREQGMKEVNELDFPVISRTIRRGLNVSFALDQWTAANIAKAYGINPATLTGGKGIYVDDIFEVNLVGSLTDGLTPLHLYLPQAVTADAIEVTPQRDKDSPLPIAFKCLDNTTSGAFQWKIGQVTPQSLTISTGTVVRVITTTPAYEIARLVIDGEGSAADLLDDITAADLAQDERIRVSIAAATAPITIVHAGGAIETKDTNDFIMTDTKDWIDFYNDLANTTWKEITRYEAV